MTTRGELYKKTLEFLIWVNKNALTHPSLQEFTEGMKLLKEWVSADVEIWLDWKEMVPEEVPNEEVFNILKAFFEHWIKKDNLHLFEEILFMFDPNDMDYKKEVVNKWNEIINN
jgi:hypothetical protein